MIFSIRKNLIYSIDRLISEIETEIYGTANFMVGAPCKCFVCYFGYFNHIRSLRSNSTVVCVAYKTGFGYRLARRLNTFFPQEDYWISVPNKNAAGSIISTDDSTYMIFHCNDEEKKQGHEFKIRCLIGNHEYIFKNQFSPFFGEY